MICFIICEEIRLKKCVFRQNNPVYVESYLAHSMCNNFAKNHLVPSFSESQFSTVDNVLVLNLRDD